MQQALSFLAWHYTTAAAFMQVLKQRAIIPCATAASKTGERPVIWFSVNDEFEVSATLPEASKGEGAQGYVRLGVPVRTLLTCAEVRRRASIGVEAWEQQCAEARAVGSDPDEWFGCMHRIALVDCVVEVRDEDGHWRRMQDAASRSLTRGRREDAGTHGSGSHHHPGR